MDNRDRYLQVALVVAGLIFVVGLYSLIILWPSGWAWHMEKTYALPHYLQMMVGVYVTLGIFLLIASRDPMKHLSLIWFTVWSSVVHATIMMLQSLANPEHRGHLWGDVPALFLLAAALAYVTHRATAGRSTQRIERRTAA
jgi:hypothetical protein